MIYISFLGLFFYSYSSAMEKPEKKKGCAELFQAIEIDDRETVADIITTNVRCIYKSHKANYSTEKVTALHVAAYYGRNACLKMLLDHVDANIRTKREYIPLHYVKNLKAAQILEKKGAFIDTKASNGATPFMCAVEKELFNVAEFFLEKKADINNVYCNNYTALHRAVIVRQPQAVEFLLAHGADANKQNEQGRTAFDMVLQEVDKDNIQKIRKIFEKYGMILFPLTYYNTLIQDPSKWNDSVSMSYRRGLINKWALLFAGVKNTIVNINKNKCMTQGIIVNEYGVIVKGLSDSGLEKLFGKDAVKHIYDLLEHVCKTTLSLIQQDETKYLQQEIETYPFAVTYDSDIAQEMMFEALRLPDTACLKVLLEKGINGHQRVWNTGEKTCHFNGTYLHQAVFCNNPAAIELLMNHGVDCLLCDQQGLTPIEYAQQEKRDDCVARLNLLMGQKFITELYKNNYKVSKQLLLQMNDCNIEVGWRGSLLYSVIGCPNHKKRDKHIMILKDKGANFDVASDGKKSPLWHAIDCCKDAKNICEILLNMGASVDIANGNGMSLLNIAAFRKNLE